MNSNVLLFYLIYQSCDFLTIFHDLNGLMVDLMMISNAFLELIIVQVHDELIPLEDKPLVNKVN